MKPRHAAALALVGWYLMNPPTLWEKCTPGGWNPGDVATLGCIVRLDPQAPLREWERVPDSQEFEYKTDCQRAISKDCYTEVERDGTKSLMGSLCHADCIAADDPRLKKK
jgi:hypothetical protein